MRRLGPNEFIDVATTPTTPPEEEEAKPDPSEVKAMEMMFQAFGPNQMIQTAKRSDSIMRRIHSELAAVQRRDGSTKVASANQRTAAPDSRLPQSFAKFEMARDWDPTDHRKARTPVPRCIHGNPWDACEKCPPQQKDPTK